MTEPRIPTARNVRYYSERIAKEVNLPVQVIHKVLMFGWKHICKMIERKEDVTLPKLGRLYFEKKPRHIKKKHAPHREDSEHQTAGNEQPGHHQEVQYHPDPWDR